MVLPALPVHRCPVIDGVWPFSSFLASLCALWDDQKDDVARRIGRAT